MKLAIDKTDLIPAFISAHKGFIMAYLGAKQQFCVITRDHSLINSIHSIYIRTRFTPPTPNTLNILLSGILL